MSWRRHAAGRTDSNGKDSAFRQFGKLKAKEIVLFPDFLPYILQFLHQSVFTRHLDFFTICNPRPLITAKRWGHEKQLNHLNILNVRVLR